ncbi:hypothetical protein KUTeg_018093 [Tegillarca granosa]|uniref:Heme-binding protein 2 n=1 Tax=Tegillarca granosa TaxID=220873 RepID=A0ABQ9ELS5_TEGGR|nr:hypothetical protein KUTeg_018093 [Tegillarca granosa]
MSGKQIIICMCILFLSGEALALPWWLNFWSSDTTEYTYPAEVANSCKENECPSYTVVNSFGDYELRRYEPSVWIATNVTGRSNELRSAKRSMFWSLFRYITGANTEGTKIKMTAPVLKNMSRACDTCEGISTMYFMIPAKHRNNPPAPTNSAAYLVNMPAMEVYVRYFGGRPSNNEKMTQLENLEQSLTRDAKNYESSYYIEAGYDSPWTMFKRRNEMWLVAK